MTKAKKNIPEFIQAAQSALQNSDLKEHPDYTLLKKALPTLAAKLHQNGQPVTVDFLMTEALEGAEHLKSLSDRITVKKEPTYQDIVAAFPLTLEEQLLKTIEAKDIKALEKLIETNLDIHAVSNMALSYAAKYGHMDIVELLIDKGADIHTHNDLAFRKAAANGHMDIVGLLIDKGADIHTYKDEALRGAATNGHMGMVRLLIDKGADIHAGDNEALRKAALCGYTDIVGLLIDKGADIHAGDNEALQYAAYDGHIDIVKLLIDKDADIHACEDWALRYAAQNGHIDIVKLLIDKGADIHACDDDAVRYAAQNGHTDIVKLLLGKGADIHSCDDEAFRDAARNGHTDIVKLLLDKGADIHSCDDEAFRDAALNGHIDTVNLLIDKGANIHAHHDDVLQVVALKGHIDIVKLLIDKGADIHAGDNKAIRYAAFKGHMDIVKLLIDKDADIHACEDWALRYAAENGHIDIVKLLIDKGADIHACDDDAVRYAAQNGHTDIVNFLIEKGADINKLCDRSRHMLERYKIWEKAGMPPPKGCLEYDPSVFKDKSVRDCFKFVTDILQTHEGYGYQEEHANSIANAASFLFGDTKTVLRYLKRHGSAEGTPLHDVLQNIILPKGGEEDINWASWRSAILQHGPKMAKLLKFANKVQTPLRSPDGDNWLYYDTLKEVSKHAYPKARENPHLASLMLAHTMDEDDFSEALKLTKKYIKAYGALDADKKGLIPDISFKLPNGMTYKKLPDGNFKGMVLGEITDCCQSVGGHGDGCASHGYLSKDSGFYVVLDKKGDIIGQSWAWIGKNNELVLDSLEALNGRVSKEVWHSISTEFAKHLEDKAPNITALHIGTGGRTPKLDFNKDAAKPKDYDGYRDSKKQYRVWSRTANSKNAR